MKKADTKISLQLLRTPLLACALLLLLLLALSPTATRAQISGSGTTRVQTAEAARGVRIEAVPFQSRLIGAALPYNVVLPPGYDEPSAKETRYPVLYLLHGLGGSAGDWVSSRAHLAEHAARHQIIIVTPEGKDSWYTDSATAPSGKFESYFMQELIPDVQSRYRAIDAREGRAVAGLSMGGYGALKFGLKYPDRFIFAASMSGALAAAAWNPEENLPGFIKPSIARVYGPMNSPVRAANDIYRIVREMTAERAATLPFLYLDCGTEDFLISFNRDMAALLLEKKIPHEYRQLPGAHNWPYWDRQVQEVLRLAAQRFNAPRAAATVNR